MARCFGYNRGSLISPRPIVRRLLTIFLFLIIPLHAFALQGGWSPEGNGFNLAHEIDHEQGNSHHHHDEDDSIHYDDSAESAKHLAEPDCCHIGASLPPALLQLSNLSPPARMLCPPGEMVPDHFPECPQRPPSALG